MGGIGKRVLSWDDVTDLVRRLLDKLPSPWEYDAILAITRGGMIPACLISEATNIRNIMVAAVMFYESPVHPHNPFFLQFPESELVRGKRLLVVDDIWGNGKIAMAVKVRLIGAGARPEMAVLHYRPGESLYPNERPDYCAEETADWVVYPWDHESAE